MDGIDVIDTAVKVGMGALISGAATYFVTALNHKSERDKERARRSYEILLQVTEHADKYFNSVSRTISFVDGMIKGGIGTDRALTDDVLDEFRERVDKELVEARRNRSFAHSRLRLIGEAQCARHLEQMVRFEEIRTQILFDRKVPRLEELHEFGLQWLAHKDAFFKELNATYQRLLDH